MTIRRHALHKLAISTFLLTIPFHAAHAQDANAVAERFKKVLGDQNINLAWKGVSGDASSLVLEGVTFTPASQKEAVTLGNVTLDGVTEQDGGYRIETISTEPYSFTQEGAKIDISAATFTGVTLPPEGETDPVASMMMYDGMDLANVSVTMADKTVFAMDGLSFEVTPPADGKALEFTGSAEKFTADLSMAEDPQAKKVIEALGYQTISGNFEMAGSWQPTDGRMGLTQYDITVDDAGTFGFTFDLGGYTPAFLKSLQELQKKMAEQPAGADNSAQGLAMLGLMQQLTFHTANIRFDDDLAHRQGSGLCRQTAEHEAGRHRQPGQGDRAVPDGAAQQPGTVGRNHRGGHQVPRRSEEHRDRRRADSAGTVRADRGRRHGDSARPAQDARRLGYRKRRRRIGRLFESLTPRKSPAAKPGFFFSCESFARFA
ncbi:hypothetical protein ACG873_08380 [Mesorhizobium sp. AaZ16]|uniref:hypothetical protein n=1 Tax=Mesorhizobium sp. AaZ16 TaxID=3402289 RepID=UPI00374E5A05